MVHWPMIWICVYVPGTSLNKPFPDYATGKDNCRSIDLSFVLGHGTWLEGCRSIRLTTFLRQEMLLLVSSQVPDLRLVTICVLSTSL